MCLCVRKFISSCATNRPYGLLLASIENVTESQKSELRNHFTYFGTLKCNVDKGQCDRDANHTLHHQQSNAHSDNVAGDVFHSGRESKEILRRFDLIISTVLTDPFDFDDCARHMEDNGHFYCHYFHIIIYMRFARDPMNCSMFNKVVSIARRKPMCSFIASRSVNLFTIWQLSLHATHFRCLFIFTTTRYL